MIKYKSLYFEPYKIEKQERRFIVECISLLESYNYKVSEKLIKTKLKKIIKRLKK